MRDFVAPKYRICLYISVYLYFHHHPLVSFAISRTFLNHDSILPVPLLYKPSYHRISRARILMKSNNNIIIDKLHTVNVWLYPTPKIEYIYQYTYLPACRLLFHMTSSCWLSHVLSLDNYTTFYLQEVPTHLRTPPGMKCC